MTLTLFIAVILITSIVVTFASVGSTLIITKSFLFRPLQRLFDPDYHMGVDAHPYLCRLFTCPQCMGTWVGFILQLAAMLVLYHTIPVLIIDGDIILNVMLYPFIAMTVIFQGFISSGLSLWFYLILKQLGYKTE